MNNRRFLHLFLVVAVLIAGALAPLVQPSAVLASAPATPVYVSPAPGTTVSSLTPTLIASAYSDNDAQAASEWLVAGFDYPDYDAPFTSFTVPSSYDLEYSTTYTWQVRYMDVNLEWSAWSTAYSFTTPAAAPTVTGVSPSSGKQGETLSVTITGTGFTDASVVSFGSGIAVSGFSVDTATQITASLSISSSAATGTRDVSVTTPGGTGSKSAAFTVDQGPPTITTVAPASGAQGTASLSVTITGTNFTGATAVSFGDGITATYVVNSATKITATLSISAGATLGTRDVSVTTPGGTATKTGAFTVVGAPTITAVTPATGAPGTTALSVTITGTNFTGATAVGFGDGITATYVVNSATQITATINIGSTAAAGARDVSVTTSAGTGTKTAGFTVSASLTADFTADRQEVALGQSVAFTSQVVGQVGTLTYAWDFENDGTVDSTLQNPSYVYASTGVFTVVLKVTDSANPTPVTVTRAQYITVTSNLLADFTADKTEVVVGQTVQFTNVSGGGVAPLTYQWDFNGDNTWDSTVQNPSYTYATAGIYRVSLKVTDSKGNTDTENKDKYITVSVLAQADFTANATAILPGQTVTFTASSTGGTPPLTYSWDFNGDGTFEATGQQATYSYTAVGAYTVSLKVTDAGGNSDTETKIGYITVGSVAVAPSPIPTGGGAIQTADGKVSTTFPAGSYDGNGTLNILEVTLFPTPPEGYKAGSACYTIEAKDGNGRVITSLSRPATITMKYTDADMAAAGGKPGNLVLAYYTPATDKWEIVTTSLNDTNRTLSTTTTHFSTWAILVKTPSSGLAWWAKLLIILGALVVGGIVVWKAFAIKQADRAPDYYH